MTDDLIDSQHLQMLAASRPDPSAYDRLHQRLERSAQDARLLDIAYTTIDTPVGVLTLAATPVGLVRVAYEVEGHDAVLQTLADRISPRILRSPGRLEAAAYQLDEYFAGRRTEFDLALDRVLSTGFRRTVQELLPSIGYGRTESYAQVAARVGSPQASRAVGTACATNPLPVVIPCHRVLRTDGTLGGYIGGTAVKTRLLELEGAR